MEKILHAKYPALALTTIVLLGNLLLFNHSWIVYGAVIAFGFFRRKKHLNSTPLNLYPKASFVALGAAAILSLLFFVFTQLVAPSDSINPVDVVLGSPEMSLILFPLYFVILWGLSGLGEFIANKMYNSNN